MRGRCQWLDECGHDKSGLGAQGEPGRLEGL